MAEGSYKQFCPVAMAAEILCSRWTLVVLRELVVGSTRFNDLRRGVPRMSPALLSKRLKDLETAGVIEKVAMADDPEISEYRLTKCGRDLKAVVEAVGIWGQRWVGTKLSVDHLDVGLLMWDMRRHLNPEPMPKRKSTIQITYTDLEPVRRKWWLVVEPGAEVDLCSVDPGFDVDLFISVDLRTMTEAWMGHRLTRAAVSDGLMTLIGSRELETKMPQWLGLSPFAKFPRAVA
ncbi:MAG: transcriptional regulator [Rhodobacterales bacterium 32-67-9]|nr:MAG: transcriptional regulator [Rhodobacterales bacterium 32-67-9]